MCFIVIIINEDESIYIKNVNWKKPEDLVLDFYGILERR